MNDANIDIRIKRSTLGRLVAAFRRWQEEQEEKARARAIKIAAFHDEAERLYHLSMKPLTQAEFDTVVTGGGREAATAFLDARLKGRLVDIVCEANEQFHFGLPTFSTVCRFLQELDMAAIKNMHGFELVGWSGSGRVIQDAVKIAEERGAEQQKREMERKIREVVRREVADMRPWRY